MNTNNIIAVNPNTPQQTPMITLEVTSVILGIIVSLLSIGGAFFKIISGFNSINSRILLQQKEIDDNKKILEQVEKNKMDFYALDKQFSNHIVDCSNNRDSVQMILGQLDQKIDHKAQRLESEILRLREKE